MCIFLPTDWFSQLHVYLGKENTRVVGRTNQMTGKYTCENTRVFFSKENTRVKIHVHFSRKEIDEINPRG